MAAVGMLEPPREFPRSLSSHELMGFEMSASPPHHGLSPVADNKPLSAERRFKGTYVGSDGSEDLARNDARHISSSVCFGFSSPEQLSVKGTFSKVLNVGTKRRFHMPAGQWGMR
jgi:hypothetical protein